MTSSERQNYRMALLITVSFHAAIFFIYFPQNLLTKPFTVDTFSVGIMDLSGGAGSSGQGNSALLDLPKPKQIIARPPKKVSPKPRIQTPVVKTNQTALPKSDNNQTVTVTGKPDKNITPNAPLPKNVLVAGTSTGADSNVVPVTGTQKGTPGSSGTGTGPIGLGSGEGMLSAPAQKPPYPKNAVNEGKEGDVTVRILIRANGSLEDVVLVKSSGDSRLDKAVKLSIERDWKFKSLNQNYYIDLVFSFRLDSNPTVLFTKSETRP